MATVGGISRHYNLVELTVPRDFPSFQSVATRQTEARSNLGIEASSAELAVLDGALAGFGIAGKVVVTDANNGITLFRDNRTLALMRMGVILAFDATGTLTAANITGNTVITSTTAAAVNATLPTGTLTETAVLGLYPGAQLNDTFEISVINTGPNTFTILTAAGWTLVGSMAVATGTSGTFRARRTAANTYILYRIS